MFVEKISLVRTAIARQLRQKGLDDLQFTSASVWHKADFVITDDNDILLSALRDDIPVSFFCEHQDPSFFAIGREDYHEFNLEQPSVDQLVEYIWQVYEMQLN